MKIIIAPQAFKGTLRAAEVANAMKTGFRLIFPEADIQVVLLSDGGDGTLEALHHQLQIHHSTATNAANQPILAPWGLLLHTKEAVIETAKICGLAMLSPNLRHPSLTTTHGVGAIIIAALNRGVRRFFIGLGGTATNDGGSGMAEALGIKFLDKQGRSLSSGGSALIHLQNIDTKGLDPRILHSQFLAACDVVNPLVGDNGATAIYAAQKGGKPDEILRLEEAMQNFSRVVKKDLGIEIAQIPYGGAAGGLGGGLHAFLRATLRCGIEEMMERVHFKEQLSNGSLVLTGEGRLDSQTYQHKTVWGVAHKAKELGIPVLAIAGQLEEGLNLGKIGIDRCFLLEPGISDPGSIVQAAKKAALYWKFST